MNPNKRLLSLDVLRGITVAGMILVNNTGKCGYNFAAFAHAKLNLRLESAKPASSV